MATRIEARSRPDGTTEVFTFEIPDEERKKLDAMTEGVESELSPARRRLLQATKAPVSLVEPIEVNGEWWYPRRLDFARQTLFGTLVQRNEAGEIDITADTLAGITVALLYVGTAADESGAADYFQSTVEAWDWAHSVSDEITAIVGALFAKLIELNPKLLTPAKADTRKGAQKKSASTKRKRRSAAVKNKTSSTPPTT